MGEMTFDWRKFLQVFLVSGLASFVTFFVIQYFQGRVDDILHTAGRAFLVGLGLALLFSIQRQRKDYPWM
jgi:peptidoglycan/LPS O-acetylase OafA/YrhL